jgi:hypothetical protein
MDWEQTGDEMEWIYDRTEFYWTPWDRPRRILWVEPWPWWL